MDLLEPLADAIGRHVLNGQAIFVDDTPVKLLNPIAPGRKIYLFIGSLGGAKAAAIAYTLIETAKLNGVDPQTWLTDVLGRIADQKITRFYELLPWRCAQIRAQLATGLSVYAAITGRSPLMGLTCTRLNRLSSARNDASRRYWPDAYEEPAPRSGSKINRN